jgi:hypothetical protein
VKVNILAVFLGESLRVHFQAVKMQHINLFPEYNYCFEFNAEVTGPGREVDWLLFRKKTTLLSIWR